MSAVIPVYNGERYLAEAIQSVLDQTSPVECIVVDDGSTDGSVAVAERFGDDVRIVAQSNRGVSAARNAGARESSRSLLAFLDADDTWHPEKIEKQVRVREDRGTDAVLCGLEMTDATGTPVGKRMYLARDPLLLRRMLLFDGVEVPSCSSTLLVTRDAFWALGGFDERLSMSADWFFFVRYLLRYGLPADVDEPLTFYRRHDENMSHSVDKLERDMLAAYDSVFADAALPEDTREDRRLSYYRLHRMLAGSFLDARDWRGAARNGTRMARTAPAELMREALRRLGAIFDRRHAETPR